MGSVVLSGAPDRNTNRIHTVSGLITRGTVERNRFATLGGTVSSLFPLDASGCRRSIRMAIVDALTNNANSNLVLPISLCIGGCLRAVERRGSTIVENFFVLPSIVRDIVAGRIRLSGRCSGTCTSVERVSTLVHHPCSVRLRGECPGLGMVIPGINNSNCSRFGDSPFGFYFLFGGVGMEDARVGNGSRLLRRTIRYVCSVSISPVYAHIGSRRSGVVERGVSSKGGSDCTNTNTSGIICPCSSMISCITLG